jgi:hypothetical protein
VRGFLTSCTIFLLNEMTYGSLLCWREIQCVKWLKAKSMILEYSTLQSADIIVRYKLVLWSFAKTLVDLWTWTILQSKRSYWLLKP